MIIGPFDFLPGLYSMRGDNTGRPVYSGPRRILVGWCIPTETGWRFLAVTRDEKTASTLPALKRILEKDYP